MRNKSSGHRALLALASLKLTLFGFLWLAIASVAIYKSDSQSTPWLAAPLLLLAVNLMATVVSSRAFRRQVPLLLFHIALVALVLLAAMGRLSYLKAQVELTQGMDFEEFTSTQAGPLYWGDHRRLQFGNDGFSIDYLAGPQMDKNVSHMYWRDDSGNNQHGDIESNQPLVLRGYRIYPTSNKGFAPLFVWHQKGLAPVLGAVHLPSYPARAHEQAKSWRVPGLTQSLWVMLPVEEDLIPMDRPSQFRLPKEQGVVVRYGDRRVELGVGESMDFPQGTLHYQELRTWMGYSVSYDWTVAWMLGVCMLAVLSMAWHFWRKFAARPW